MAGTCIDNMLRRKYLFYVIISVNLAAAAAARANDRSQSPRAF